MMALMGLVSYPGRVRADKLRFAGHDLLALSDGERSKLTGKDVAMIFQDPTTSLNPCFTVGFQITETLRLHLGLDRKAATRKAIELLEQVGIPAPESRLKAYPHQLSGGMNQRVMIAMAIALQPAAADCRRTHDGARRDHPGANPGPAAQPAKGTRHGAGADHPQHGRGVRDGAARGGHVCGPDHGRAKRPCALQHTPASLYRSTAGRTARAQRWQHAPDHHSRHGARPL